MLRKRFFAVLLCLCMAVGMLPTAALAADYYIDYDLSDTSHPFDGIDQWDDTYGHQLRCTYVAWHEAKSRLGIELFNRQNLWGHAGSWAQGAKNSGYQTGSTPAVNSIICWSGGAWGHVAFVTEVSGSTITVVEGGYGTNTYPKAHVRTIGSSGWSNGTFIYLASSQPTAPVQNLGDDFFAYIYNPHSGCNIENRSFNVQLAAQNQTDNRQIWHFIRQSDGSYKIINMYDGLYLDVSNAGTAWGTNVQVMTGDSNPNDAQKWFVCGSNSRYYFAPGLSKDHALVLDIANGHEAAVPPGRNVCINKSWYGAQGSGDPFHVAQTFQVVKISSPAATLANDLGKDFYARVSYQNSYLETTGVITENGQNMDVVTCHALKANDAKQIWHFTRQDDGSYKIVNEYAGWCLDVADASIEDGTRVRTWVLDNGSLAQRWYLMKSPGDSAYRIASALEFPDSIHSLDIPVSTSGAEAPDGMRPTIFKQHQNSNQFFAISTISYTPPAKPLEPRNVQVSATAGGTAVRWDEPAGQPQGVMYTVVILSDATEQFLYKEVSGTSCVSNVVLPAGRYTVCVMASDAAGNTASTLVPFTVQPGTCTLRVSASPAAGGTVSGGGSYQQGGQATLTAAPNSGYRFVEWRLNGRRVSGSASYTFTVRESQSYTAVFEKQSDTIHGTITVDALFSPYSPVGEAVTLRVFPDTGYQLNSIRVVGSNGQTVALSGSGNTYTFLMPSFDVTVYADYVKK